MRYIAVRAYSEEEHGEHLVVDLRYPTRFKGETANVIIQSGLQPHHARILASALNDEYERQKAWQASRQVVDT